MAVTARPAVVTSASKQFLSEETYSAQPSAKILRPISITKAPVKMSSTAFQNESGTPSRSVESPPEMTLNSSATSAAALSSSSTSTTTSKRGERTAATRPRTARLACSAGQLRSSHERRCVLWKVRRRVSQIEPNSASLMKPSPLRSSTANMSCTSAPTIVLISL